MGWFDEQADLQEGTSMEENPEPTIEVQLPGTDSWIKINKNQVKRRYSDELGGALVIVVDEVAELLTPSGLKTESAKEEDMLKQECVNLIQSITQLGRSAGIHMLLATQRNDAKIIPGVIQNNCQFRMVCGRLGRVASMMALDSTLATTIDGSRKGAGIVSAQGTIEHVQYYYAEQEWIERWYKDRGLDKDGKQPDASIQEEMFDDFDGIEDLGTNKEVIDIEFAGVEGEVNKTPEQEFKEV